MLPITAYVCASPNPGHCAGSSRRSVTDPKRPKRLNGLRLEELSLPPSRDELANYQDMPVDDLPETYKRHNDQRVFCNRNLDLSNIEYCGFDMDYTLAEYISPAVEELTYSLIVDRLLEMGYDEELKQFRFNPDFTIRGLIIDLKLGNILKTDGYGFILRVYHGNQLLPWEQVIERYPSTFLYSHEIGSKRFNVVNTLFALPETSLFADMVSYFDNHEKYTRTDDHLGVQRGQVYLSYESMYTDLRHAVDKVHEKGYLKNEIAANLPRYVKQDPALPLLLHRFRQVGKGLFVVTNSDYKYTQTIMSFLFDVEVPDELKGKSWKDYFDVIIVSARKPAFFSDTGTALREVDQETGALKLGEYTGSSPHGRVFAGGSVEHLNFLLQCEGKRILYAGDHIFGDVLKSKKLSGWRTFLIMPELRQEFEGLRRSAPHYEHLKNLEFMLAEVYRGLASDTQEQPSTTELIKDLDNTAVAIDGSFNKYFGSAFRSGTKQSLFARQSQQYADLYSSTLLNLIHYPLFYMFNSAMDELPHEGRGWREHLENHNKINRRSPQVNRA